MDHGGCVECIETKTEQKAQGQVSVTCRIRASVKGIRATRGCRAGAGEAAAAQAVGLVAILEFQGAGVKEGQKLSEMSTAWRAPGEE